MLTHRGIIRRYMYIYIKNEQLPKRFIGKFKKNLSRQEYTYFNHTAISVHFIHQKMSLVSNKKIIRP